MSKSRACRAATTVVLALTLGIMTSLFAQKTDDVIEIASVLSRDAVYPGTVAKAAVVLKIQPGYHINDNAPLDEFMFPTSLSFEDHPGLEILEIFFPPGHAGRFAYADNELIVYEGETYLGVLFKVRDGQTPGEYRLEGTLSYQACDNVSCLPPKEVSFEVPVTVVAADRPTKEQHPEIFSRLSFKTTK